MKLPVEGLAAALRNVLRVDAPNGSPQRWPWLINIPLLGMLTTWNAGGAGATAPRMRPAELYQLFLRLQDEDDTKRIAALQVAAARYPVIADAIAGYDVEKYMRFSQFLRAYKDLVRAGVDASAAHAEGAVNTLLRALRRRAGELEAAAANSYRLNILDVAPRAVSQWIDKYRLILKGERMQTTGWVPADLLAVFNSDPRIIALNSGAPLMLRYASLREVGARQRIFINRAALASLADSQQPGLPTLKEALELQGFRDILRKEPDLARPKTEMTTLDQLLQYITHEAVRAMTSILPRPQSLGQFTAAAGELSPDGSYSLHTGAMRRATVFVRVVWEHVANYVVDQISVAHEISRVEVMRYLHGVHGTNKYETTHHFFSQILPSAMLHRAAGLATENVFDKLRMDLLDMATNFLSTHHEKAAELQVDVLGVINRFKGEVEARPVFFGEQSDEASGAPLAGDLKTMLDDVLDKLGKIGNPTFWESPFDARVTSLAGLKTSDARVVVPTTLSEANAAFYYHVVSLQMSLLTRLADVLNSKIRESLMDMDMAFGDSLKHGLNAYALRSVIQLETTGPLADDAMPPRPSLVVLPDVDLALRSTLMTRRFVYINPAAEITQAATGLRRVTQAVERMLGHSF